ncbi:MAG: hypothetical protein EOO51_01405 [Flavobacterium sp.]|nr:MAG: hypothetical protein EOO51_01405 [Flavobacterium sp.]
MIDNLRIAISNKGEFESNILNNNILTLKSTLDYNTGEIAEYPKKGKYENLDIRISSERATIVGSIHKYFNMLFKKGNQNYNDFTIFDLRHSLQQLRAIFGLHHKTAINALEMGFNLEMEQDPQTYIDNNILMYDLKHHNIDRLKSQGDFKRFDRTDYSLKIYNKSKQFQTAKNLLRIEIRITSKRLLHKLRVHEMEDLSDAIVLKGIFQFLMNKFEKVIIVDRVNEVLIPPSDVEKLNKYTNPNYWKRIKSEKSYKVIRRLNKDFERILNKYRLNTLKNRLRDELHQKFLELT